MENCGREDSLQNANHCRPTVFVYMKVAFKCRADIIRPHGEPPYTIREDSLWISKNILCPSERFN